ncbi:MAG TPA: hypothetical protein VGU20_08835 [Stellaceae bacterium]|nr:hypothetical protein [Stellaceae bacterium]
MSAAKALAAAFALLLVHSAAAAAQRPHSAPIYEPLPDEKQLRELALDTSEGAHLHYSLVPHGPSNILFAWGAVEYGGTENFRTALDEAKVHEVWLFSPGGSMEDGMEIGRLVRARKLTTRVPNGAHCISACNFILMGGLVRYVGTAATFEVHMFQNDAITERMREHIRQPPATLQDFIHTYPNWIKGRDQDFATYRVICTRKPVEKPQVEAFHEFCAPGSEQPLQPTQLLPEFVKYMARSWQAERMKHGAPELGDDQLVPAFLAHEAIDEDVKDIQQQSAKVAAQVARFLTEMSVSLRFLTEFANIPNDVPRPLSREELRRMNIVNVD